MASSRNIRHSLQDSKLPRLEARLLWQKVLGVSQAWLIAHDSDLLSATAWQEFAELEQRRLAGEPMAYILGWREFYGRNFMVTPAVLIPRPETELLVEAGLAAIAAVQQPRVLDLGTGSGVVAISLALERPAARVQASDVCAQALTVAQQNAAALGAQLWFSVGNWYDTELHFNCYDLIVSNPPYISLDDVHLSQGDLRFEPHRALSDGMDGLQDLRTIVSGAVSHLCPGGALCVEHGWQQSKEVRRLFQEHGFAAVKSLCDLAGIERVTCGRLAA